MTPQQYASDVAKRLRELADKIDRAEVSAIATEFYFSPGHELEVHQGTNGSRRIVRVVTFSVRYGVDG